MTHMEINKNNLFYLFDRVYNFHDSNIENISILYKSIDNITIKNYPKEKIDIRIVIQLPENEDSTISEKKVRINFFDVKEFKIEKKAGWQWLVFDATLNHIDDTFMKFTMDDTLFVIFQYADFCILEDTES